MHIILPYWLPFVRARLRLPGLLDSLSLRDKRMAYDILVSWLMVLRGDGEVLAQNSVGLTPGSCWPSIASTYPRGVRT